MKQTFLDIILKPAILVDLAIYIYTLYIYTHTHYQYVQSPMEMDSAFGTSCTPEVNSSILSC